MIMTILCVGSSPYWSPIASTGVHLSSKYTIFSYLSGMFQPSWNINRKAHCVKLWKNIILTSKIGMCVVKIILFMIKYWREEVVLYPHKNTSKWVIAVTHQVKNLSAIGWREQVAFRWDDEDIRFVLDQHV